MSQASHATTATPTHTAHSQIADSTSTCQVKIVPLRECFYTKETLELHLAQDATQVFLARFNSSVSLV